MILSLCPKSVLGIIHGSMLLFFLVLCVRSLFIQANIWELRSEELLLHVTSVDLSMHTQLGYLRVPL